MEIAVMIFAGLGAAVGIYGIILVRQVASSTPNKVERNAPRYIRSHCDVCKALKIVKQTIDDHPSRHPNEFVLISICDDCAKK